MYVYMYACISRINFEKSFTVSISCTLNAQFIVSADPKIV